MPGGSSSSAFWVVIYLVIKVGMPGEDKALPVWWTRTSLGSPWAVLPLRETLGFLVREPQGPQAEQVQQETAFCLACLKAAGGSQGEMAGKLAHTARIHGPTCSLEINTCSFIIPLCGIASWFPSACALPASLSGPVLHT